MIGASPGTRVNRYVFDTRRQQHLEILFFFPSSSPQMMSVLLEWRQRLDRRLSTCSSRINTILSFLEYPVGFQRYVDYYVLCYGT